MNFPTLQRHYIHLNVLQLNFGIEAARAHEEMMKAFLDWYASNKFMGERLNKEDHALIEAMNRYLTILKG